jgi:hypothetical protein
MKGKNSMKYKNIILLVAFSLCNTITGGETYFEREYNKIAPLLNNQNLTEEDITALMKVKTICENEITNSKKYIESLTDAPSKEELKPLTEYISEEFKKNFSYPSPMIFADATGTLAAIEGLRYFTAYGFTPITMPATFFMAIGKWWKNKNKRSEHTGYAQGNIKICEEYIKNIDAAIAKTTSP